MRSIQIGVQEALGKMSSWLEAMSGGQRLAEEFRELAGQANHPCVVAVVGQVKAGKSSFINALLGEDLATVGVTETTATINQFVFGQQQDSNRAVRCHWRGGRVTEEDLGFLDSLQGSDEATLRRAEGIDYLEYLIPNPMLREVTLVDTPGTGAVVDEHQNRTAEFLGLSAQLRQRHDEETQRLGSEADAVIYVVGPAARATEKDLLDDFSRAASGNARAFNAVGVMAKIDQQPAVLERREALAEKIAGQLKSSLNTVVPVSAGLRRALDRLLENDRALLHDLCETVRQIPEEALQLLLDDEGFFCELEPEDCPVSATQRRELRRRLVDSRGQPFPWMVFATIAGIAARAEGRAEQVVQEVSDLSGFDRLQDTLETHFFSRARILRCHRIAQDARRLLDHLRFREVAQLRRRAEESHEKLETMLAVLARTPGPADVVSEIEQLVRERYDLAPQTEQLERVRRGLDLEIGRLTRTLTEYSADFEALQILERAAEAFSQEQRDELRPLLGLYGLELEQRLGRDRDPQRARDRQIYWRHAASQAAPSSPIHRVAKRAELCYAWLLHQMQQVGAGGDASDEGGSDRSR